MTAPHADRERGSGTVLLLAVVAVAVVLAAGLGMLVSAQLARGRAQSAADLAALAAAGRLQDDARGLGGSGGSGSLGAAPCAVARDVAARNEARLVTCLADGAGVVRIQVAVGSRVGTASARARAGPASARAR